MSKITTREFEDKVRAIEDVTVVIRAPSGALVDDYNFQRCATGSSTIKDWIEARIKPRIGAYECDVVTPDYVPSTPHGKTKLSTIREQYSR